MEPQITAKELEAEPLLPKSSNEAFKVYPGRFYVLAVLALLAIQQNVAWMTFGTIPDESYEHFGLSDNVITLLAGRSYVNHITQPSVTVYTRTYMVEQYSKHERVAHTNGSIHALFHCVQAYIP